MSAKSNQTNPPAQAQPKVMGDRHLEVMALRGLESRRVISRDDADAPTSRALQKRLAESGRYIPPRPPTALPFSPAELSLIGRVHGFLEPARLLELLNERRQADGKTGTAQVSFQQLQAEINKTAKVRPSNDFVSLRKAIRQAEKDGTRAAISEATIGDFAVIFQLNAKQVITLKELILQGEEDA